MQELRSREEELERISLQQRIHEETLRRREHELAEREVQLVERELNVMILQQVIGKPTPKKRCGKFRKSRLKLLKAGGCKSISAPSGSLSLTSVLCMLCLLDVYRLTNPSIPYTTQICLHHVRKKGDTTLATWSIYVIFVPLETGMNTPQLYVIYLLKCLMTS